MYLYIYICLCVCVCVVSPLPETYLFGTRPRVQAQKTFFDIRPNSTHVRPQRICLVPLLSSPVPTHAYLSIFHPSLSSVITRWTHWIQSLPSTAGAGRTGCTGRVHRDGKKVEGLWFDAFGAGRTRGSKSVGNSVVLIP